MVSYSVIFSLLTPNQYHIKESKAKIRAITIIVIPMMRNLLLIGTLDVVGKLISTWKISMIFSLLNISINNNIEKTIIAFANAGSISIPLIDLFYSITKTKLQQVENAYKKYIKVGMSHKCPCQRKTTCIS